MLARWRIDGRQDAPLRPDDRGLAYGDGVFRTLLIHAGQVIDREGQLAHLAADAAALALDAPEAEHLNADLDWAAAQVPHASCKLLLSRQPGGRGYAATTRACRRICLLYPAPGIPPGGVTVRSCHLRLARQPALAGPKHLNRLEQVLARREWEDPAIHEGLLSDTEGCLVGGTMSNLFWHDGDKLLTPAIRHCGVAGRMRARVSALAAELGIGVDEVQSDADACRNSARELFLCNSLIGIVAISRWDAQSFKPGPVTAQLAARLGHPAPC